MKQIRHNNSEVSESRQVRVFISSTFRDMQAERDYLVKHVFPELKRRCRKRQVDFVEVDLRWGITEAQAERGELLPVCLAEIENCRPYFIGLLGERYGSVPEAIAPELMEARPWLSEQRGKSVTELEILHGVLKNTEMAGRAYFYFRDPAYAQKMSPDQRCDYVSEDPASRKRLAALKDRIRQSGRPVHENYPDPEAAGKLILEDLWQAIDEAFPEGSEPSPLDQEAAGHEAFAQSRAGVYIDRRQYFDRLDAHVNSQDQPLVLLGDSGIGKSALISNWVLQYRKAHPGDFVFLHFIGSTPGSTYYVEIIRRLMEEIKRRYALADEIPDAPEKLRQELPIWLAMVQDRMILILDGLNQLEVRDNTRHLGWLPEYFPPNIRVIASTLPGPTQDAIENRGWHTCRLEEFYPAEQARMIEEYLSLYRKSLDQRQIDRITASPHTANPLYLRLLLEELRIFGKHEELDRTIDEYLEAPTILALYDKILTRLEQDYEKQRPAMVGEALSLIWAARRGLSEGELMELLGSQQSPIPRAVWAPLFLALEDALINRSGILGFFHDYLRQAVAERYLNSEAIKKEQHERLAWYFGQQPLWIEKEMKQIPNRRKVSELPYQQTYGRCLDELEKTLCDLEFIEAKYSTGMEHELISDCEKAVNISGCLAIKYFPQCPITGSLKPYPYSHDAIPTKCIFCPYFFEGECRRVRGRLMHLDYGPCNIVGESSSVEAIEKKHPDRTIKFRIPLKCKNCKHLAWDDINAFECILDYEIWGKYRRGLDFSNIKYQCGQHISSPLIKTIAIKGGDYKTIIENLEKEISNTPSLKKNGILVVVETNEENILISDIQDMHSKIDKIFLTNCEVLFSVNIIPKNELVLHMVEYQCH